MKNFIRLALVALALVALGLMLSACADDIRRGAAVTNLALDEIEETREAAKEVKYETVIKRVLGELCNLDIADYNLALADPEIPDEIAIAIQACPEHRHFWALMEERLRRVSTPRKPSDIEGMLETVIGELETINTKLPEAE